MSHKYQVVLPDDVNLRLQAVAEVRSVKPSAMIRSLLTQQLDAIEQEPADTFAWLPKFRALWGDLDKMARANHWDVIPVTEYVRRLDAVEDEATASPDHFAAARAFWFCRWSRHALKLYGEAAAFETPGEWVDWPMLQPA